MSKLLGVLLFFVRLFLLGVIIFCISFSIATENYWNVALITGGLCIYFVGRRISSK